MKASNLHLGMTACRLLVIGVCFTILAFDGTCGTNDVQSTKFPDSLVKAAHVFRSASPTNRFSEAEQVWKELPKCPLTFEKDIGTGVQRSYDFTKPSYVLTSKDVLDLLGEPFLVRTNNGAWTYSYLIKGARTTLFIEFRSNRVVLSNLRGP